MIQQPTTDIGKQRANFLLRYTLQSFAIILIAAILLRTFFISSFVMSGWTMLPNIWPGDFMLAGKWGLANVERGEVVVLLCPGEKETICLKRVVGLPGDRIEFRDGILTINGEKAVRRKISEQVSSEQVGGGHWMIWLDTPQKGQTVPVIVPPGQVFLLNDKRENLVDSRSWGPVSMNLLEARALLVWLSLDWYENGAVRTWPRVRWQRLLRSID